MAFRNKSAAILLHKPDLLILQECSKADIESSDATFKHWVGKNPHKGLGVLGFGNHNFRVADSYKDSIHWAIPVESDTIDVLGMWAHKDAGQTYVMAVANTIEYYDEMLSKPNTVLIGDMNNNVIWDHKTRKELQWNTFIESLKLRGKQSIWHQTKNEEHGKESAHTLFWYRQPGRGYHIDFAFGSQDLIDKAHMHIGAADDWLTHSDHMPIVVDVDL
jgi:hypothetical protein